MIQTRSVSRSSFCPRPRDGVRWSGSATTPRRAPGRDPTMTHLAVRPESTVSRRDRCNRSLGHTLDRHAAPGRGAPGSQIRAVDCRRASVMRVGRGTRLRIVSVRHLRRGNLLTVDTATEVRVSARRRIHREVAGEHDRGHARRRGLRPSRTAAHSGDSVPAGIDGPVRRCSSRRTRSRRGGEQHRVRGRSWSHCPHSH